MRGQLEVRRRGAAAAAGAVLAVLLVPAPARAANVCDTLPDKLSVAKDVPVEDKVYDPARLADLATGKGVRVAVIDSGVDASHPQLRGQVSAGRDFLHNDATARQDCVGHGTAVASIIAARRVANTGFQGLAPDATIVPIRVSEQKEIGENEQPTDAQASPHRFAQAIRFAVDTAEVQVINLSLVMSANNDEVADAVQHAVNAGVIVVAAAGNHATEGNPTPYPAAYGGVIGVAATTAEGTRAAYSQHGDYVDIAAIGDQVTVAGRHAGHHLDQGTSFAAPFVSATVALLKQRYPDASADEILRRLTATADPAPGGGYSEEYGHGLLNPYRALTETLGPATRAPAAAVVMHGDDPAVVAQARRRAQSQDVALMFAGGVVVAVVVIGAVVTIVRRGRRRGWQPATPEIG
jgi:membrane-anchored mycosin MYCP